MVVMQSNKEIKCEREKQGAECSVRNVKSLGAIMHRPTEDQPRWKHEDGELQEGSLCLKSGSSKKVGYIQ